MIFNEFRPKIYLTWTPNRFLCGYNLSDKSRTNITGSVRINKVKAFETY